MITGLYVKNFRSIRDASLDLGRFTVLNGENNSGKSSVLYALQVLKNIVTSPNRSMDDLLNLNFLNLGGIEEVMFNKKINLELKIGVRSGNTEKPQDLLSYYYWTHTLLGDTLILKGRKPYNFDGNLHVSFPYTLNKGQKIEIGKSPNHTFFWNGVTADQFEGYNEQVDALLLTAEIDQCAANLSGLDVIPTHRGFSRAAFNLIPLQYNIYTEDEVATLLASDKVLLSQVSYYFKKITGKEFSVSLMQVPGLFFLQVKDPGASTSIQLVNQGMGINQIVFLLAKILYSKNRLICIDEPEIHLHPTLIEQFIRVLVEISKAEGKQFLFSTHSEHWIMSLLAEVCEGNLPASDLKVYYLRKQGLETLVEEQEVQENGQIAGGLKNFLESQMRLAQRFFPVEMPG
ncbi:MAG: AAA family ATPase [Saprospiraceae bacterium]|jgi:predicted ATPase|nr:AAA family ATPase [Saprospiraceae bacterium]